MDSNLKTVILFSVLFAFTAAADNSALRQDCDFDCDDEIDEVAPPRRESSTPPWRPLPTPRRDRSPAPNTFRLDLYCDFAASPGDSGYQQCQAAARFIVQRDSRSSYVPVPTASEPHSMQPAFAVRCDLDVIYNNGSQHTLSGDETRIAAHGGPHPSISFSIPANERFPSQSLKARLSLTGQTLFGNCTFSVERN